MGFAEAIKTCFSKYVDFSGRARRSEYWFFYLAVMTALMVAVIIDLALGTYPVVYLIGLAALFLPLLSAGVRRLHDRDHSGWWFLVVIVPFGAIALLIFFCQDSGPDNKYGPNPKNAGGPTTYTPMPGGYGPPPVA